MSDDDDILYEEDPIDIEYPTHRITLVRKHKYDRVRAERDQLREDLEEAMDMMNDAILFHTVRAESRLRTRLGDMAEWLMERGYNDKAPSR